MDGSGLSVALARQERRSHPRQYWEEQFDRVWVRDLEGHHLMVKEGKFDHRWFKFFDRHFRGAALTRDVAQRQLEEEARGGISAWTSPH